MVRKISFPKAVGAVLADAGFALSTRNEWVRSHGDYVDRVDLQISRGFDQITVNLHILDDRVRSAIQSAHPTDPFLASFSPIHVRLPTIMSGYDKWWIRSDPDGPAKVAEAVKTYALPFFDGLHSPEAMLAYLQVRGSIQWRNPTARMNVALILHRLGRTSEALSALDDPPRRIEGRWLETVEALRRYVAGDLDPGTKLP